MDAVSWILTLSILAGQLIKIPVGTHGGATLLDLAVITSCLLGLWRLKFRILKPPTFVFGGIFFILAAILSLALTPLSLDPLQTLTSFSYTIRFSVIVLLGWLIYSGTFPTLLKNIPQVLIFSGLGLAILGIWQFIFVPDLRFLTTWGWDPHYFRAASTFFDPNFLGAYMVLTLLLLFAHPRGGLNRHLGILWPALVYLALLFTFSRGSYLAFLTAFGTLSVLKRSARLGLVTILLFGGLILGFTTYQRLVAQPRGIDRTQSAEFRLTTWQQGLKLFQTHPILGVGFNTYRYALKQYNLGDEQFLKSHGASTNDSSLLFVAATTGIVGLVSYLFFLITLIKKSRKPILIAGITGLIIHSFFANSLFYPPILIWIILSKVSDITT